jgi:lipopolysaccharide export LptBFGC system permease protein LptF
VLYLIPQALPIAVPIGFTIAVVFGLRASLAGRLVVWILSAAVTCSVVSFLTLGWWAPASNQAYRTKIVGRVIPKGDNELTLGELRTRIEEIRAFDPAAPARRLSVLYHTRWALSVTPLVLAVFALGIAGHSRRATGGSALGAVLSSGGFFLLLMWTSYLAFRGSVPPLLGAWLPNITIFGVTTALTLRSPKHSAGSLPE